MPADLAKYFDIRPIDPNAAIGVVPDADKNVEIHSE
jgi:hypothetical protein